MRNVYIYCLLSVLSIVETTPLSITGHVGGKVSFNCSNWDVIFTSNEDNAKYLCYDPCKTDEDIIVKAESGQTKTWRTITLTNSGKYLLVSINELKKSDSGTYVCGLDIKFSTDEFIQVHLNVKDAPNTTAKMTTPTTTTKMTTPATTTKMTTPITTTKMTITMSTLHHPDASTMISVVSTTTMLHKSSSSSVGAGLLVGLAGMLAVTVVALLMFCIKRTRKPQVSVLSARNPTEDDGETHTNEETRGEDQSTGLSMSPVYTTINIMPAVDPTSNIYANANDDIHQDPSDSVVYDTVVTSEESVTFNVDLHPNPDIKMPQISSLVPSVNEIPDEDLYSLAQLPKDQAIPIPQ